MMVSTLETDPVFSKCAEIEGVGARHEVDVARRRESRAERDGVEFAPPTMLSTLEIVAVLAALPSVSLSLPSPRSTEAFESWVETVMVSAPVPPIRRLDVGDRARVG